MARYDVIRIDYPGNCISVNHYLGRRKGGGYYVKQEAKDWMNEFQWLLKKYHFEDYNLSLLSTILDKSFLLQTLVLVQP